MSFKSEVRQVVFTDPVDGGAATHTTLLLQLVADTPAKASIHICISHFNDKTVADAVIAAAQRGVAVRMILRSSNSDIAGYFALNDPGSRVQIIQGVGCYGDSIHTKLFLFSETLDQGEQALHVVLLGSFTLNTGGLNQQQNAMVISDESLYTGLVAHWEGMRARAHNDPDKEPDIAGGDLFSASGLIKAYLFPRGSDAARRVFGNVEARRHPSTNERPTIRVAMARWTSSARGRALLTALLAAGIRGCRIEFVLRRDKVPAYPWFWTGERELDDGVSTGILGLLLLCRLFVLPNRMTLHWGKVGGGEKDVHTKYFTVSGFYPGSPDWKEMVWTGSANFTASAVSSNDEIMVKVTDAEVHRLYRANFDKIKSYCPGF